MELRGVHHVSINVTDLDETLRFYTETVGLERLWRPSGIGEGAWLGCPDGREIHLICQPVPENHGQHYAFEVADVDATRATLEAAGRRVRSTEIDGVCRQVFCRDPSGNLVEFNQPLRTP